MTNDEALRLECVKLAVVASDGKGFKGPSDIVDLAANFIALVVEKQSAAPVLFVVPAGEA